MAKTEPAIFKYQGYRFFKEREDGDFDIIRVIRISEWNNKITYKNEDTGEIVETSIESIKGFTPLSPIGYIVIGSATMKDYETNTLYPDIIVSLFNITDVKMGIEVPYAICRQSVSDFFYTILKGTDEHEFVGVSSTRDDYMATNVPYEQLMMCYSINDKDVINIYLNDTLESILECVDTKKYDKVLLESYIKHMKSKNLMFTLTDQSPKCDYGWCQDLKTLLQINNFMNDVDVMRNITCFDFEIEKELVTSISEDGTKHQEFNNELLQFFNYTFKINAVRDYVIPYYYDIDLAEFKNQNYVLIRDSKGILYLVVYLVEGEYLQQELIDETNKPQFFDRFKVSFYDKYNK